jgi:type III secretion system (T3SS) SseB-like protein
MTEPEITADMRASARANPNSWLYVIDPAFDAEDDVPPWGVVGAYAVDERGEIEEGFHHNPRYRPSPVAPAATELERLLELVKAGEREQAELLPAVRDARLLLYAASAQDASVTGFPDAHGTVMVPACTSAATVPAAWPGWREITGRDLVPLLSGHPLVINPNGPITALIPAEHLAGR